MRIIFLIAFATIISVACQNNKTDKNNSEETKEESSKDLATKRISTIKKNLIGQWKLTAVKDEELTESEKSTEITFKSDGVVSNSTKENVEKWDVKLTDDGKEFLSIGEQEMEIISCDDKKLIFLANKEEVTLMKK